MKSLVNNTKILIVGSATIIIWYGIWELLEILKEKKGYYPIIITVILSLIIQLILVGEFVIY